jgi:hypothetical protein
MKEARALRFRDREERERYMDSLEQQMEHQRKQIESALDRTEGSGWRRRALEKLRSSLPRFSGSTSGRDVEELEAATEKRQEGEASRSWWRIWR